LQEASAGLSTKNEPDVTSRLASRFDSGDQLARRARNLSQDRWSFTGSARTKARPSFEAVIGASPLRAREGDTFLRTRTPSPTAPILGGRPSDDNWTFGTKSTSLGSPRSHSFAGKASLTTSPPRSPRSFRAVRGAYL
jgi:hypothetical protein